MYLYIFIRSVFADDSLFPTSWVNKNLINLSNEESVKNYRLYFIELDKTISNLFIGLKQYGEIYIVTNANIKWVKTCLSILTNTRKVIMEQKIRIVSARDIYSQTFNSPTEWKINIFRDILGKIIINSFEKSECNTFINVISIGDAHYEYIALLNLDNYFTPLKI
jgi:hypothetical protein